MAQTLLNKSIAVIRNPLSWAISFFLLQLILLILALKNNFSKVPFWDMWNGGLEWYLNLPKNGLASYFEQHNEHRIPLARLLFWLDFTFFKGFGVFLIVVNVVLALILCALLFRASRAGIETDGTSSKSALGVALCALFGLSWLQSENFAWSFQSEFFLAYLVPLLTFVAYSKALKFGGFWTAITLLLGFISAFTMSNGLIVLPLLLIATLLIRHYRSLPLMLLSMTAFCFVVFFQGYNLNSTGPSPLNNLIGNPLGVLKFFVLLLGSPGFFVFGKDYAAAGLAGCLGITLLTVIIFIFYGEFKKTKFSALGNPVLLYVLYSLASLFAISAGRVDLGLNQVFASRYCTPVLFLFLAVALFLIYNHYPSKIVTQSLIVLLIPFTLFQVNGALTYQPDKQERNLAGIATSLGIEDKEVTDRIWPFENAKTIARRATNAHISIFGFPPFVGLYTKIGSLSNDYSSKCTFYIESVENQNPMEKFVRVRGWLATSRGAWGEFVSLINSQGVMIGLGTTGNVRPDVLSSFTAFSKANDFSAYVTKDNLLSQGKNHLSCGKSN